MAAGIPTTAAMEVTADMIAVAAMAGMTAAAAATTAGATAVAVAVAATDLTAALHADTGLVHHALGHMTGAKGVTLSRPCDQTEWLWCTGRHEDWMPAEL